jgi:hypothetical protein
MTAMSRRERRGRNRPSLFGVVTSIGKAVFYGLMGLLAIAMVVLVVLVAADSSARIVWGTYTETSRDYNLRGGWSSTGNWQSDDQTLVLTDIRLSGEVGPDGTARAGYRPDAAIGDEVVYTAVWVDSGVWVGLAVLGAIMCLIARQANEWGHWPRRRRRVANPQRAQAAE